MMSPSQRRGCAGMSLIELVAVIGVQSVLLAMAVGLIARLLEGEQSGRKEVQAQIALDALAEQFRRDVNVAMDAEISQSGGGSTVFELELSPDRRATYEVHSGRRAAIRAHAIQTSCAVRRIAFPSCGPFPFKSCLTNRTACCEWQLSTNLRPRIRRPRRVLSARPCWGETSVEFCPRKGADHDVFRSSRRGAGPGGSRNTR